MATSEDLDKEYGVIDTDTPKNTQLSARYKQSHAYKTIRIHLPAVITSIIDNLRHDKDEVAAQFGEKSRDDLDNIIAKLSKLKNEMQTDARLVEFTENEPDKDVWNECLAQIPEAERTIFKASLLLVHCYVNRRIFAYFEASETLKNYDLYGKQKMNSLIVSVPAMEVIVGRLPTLEKSSNALAKLLKLNLWGNRCDLSLSAGADVVPLENLFDLISTLDKNVLIDQSLEVWNCLTKTGKRNAGEPHTVSIIADNSGFELFTDLVLADYIIEKKLAAIVRFHVKAIPWFISDVTERDFHWALQWLKENKSTALSEMGKKWTQFVADGKFKLASLEHFWTSPYEYYKMRDIKPALYHRLAKSKMAIFKGDLNHRKLLGEMNWDYTAEFITCLRGFLPTNICTLRSIKTDLICGLGEGVAEALNKKDPDWMQTGEYGVIQCAVKVEVDECCVITTKTCC